MFCTSCGAQVSDDASFCTNCGAPLQKATNPEAENALSQPTEPESVPESTMSQSDSPYHTTAISDVEVFESIRAHAESPSFAAGANAAQNAPGYTSAIDPNSVATAPVTAAPVAVATAPFAPAAKPKSSTRKIVIIVIVVCLVVALAAGIGFFAYTQHKADEEAHLTTEVQFAFSYSGDSANEPIGVPLLVEGTDLDGNHAEQQILATSNGGTLDFLAGSYTVSVAGQPASSGGVVYEVQGEATRSLEIPVPSENDDAPSVIIPDLNYSFIPVAADKVTDQQVSAIKEWMTTYGVDPNEIQQVATAIINRRTSVIEAARQQEIQTALNANPDYIGIGQTSRLTGTVCVDSFTGRYGSGTVCYLQLPKDLRVPVHDEMSVTSNRVRLTGSFSSYQGQVITITATYTASTEKTYLSACSPIAANDPSVIRVFS